MAGPAALPTVYFVFNQNGSLHLTTTDQQVALARAALIEGFVCPVTASVDFAPRDETASSGS